MGEEIGMMGTRLCLRAKEDGVRCTLLLVRDGKYWRCPAGHVWSATGQRIDRPEVFKDWRDLLVAVGSCLVALGVLAFIAWDLFR